MVVFNCLPKGSVVSFPRERNRRGGLKRRDQNCAEAKFGWSGH